MKALVSIIVPIYNVEKYIYRCLDSIIHQTYKNLEIILVDDGSIDDSSKICDNYSDMDQRIKVIHKENGGLGYARNSGLDNATGKFVTFIDGDDFIGLTHIEDMMKLIQETDTDTCIAGHTKVYGDKEKKHINVCAGKVFRDDIKKEILPRMCGADSSGDDYIEMSVCMVLLSNDIIQKNGLRFVSERDYVSEDLVFDFDYYPLSKGICVSDSVDYFYCDNNGSLTTKYREDRFENQIKLYKFLLTKAETLGIFPDVKARLQNTVIAIARYCVKLEYKFNKEHGSKFVQNHVLKICENDILIRIFEEYCDKGTNIKSRIVNYLIKNKKIFILKYVMILKNVLGI